jgi:hypothetical protein
MAFAVTARSLSEIYWQKELKTHLNMNNFLFVRGAVMTSCAEGYTPYRYSDENLRKVSRNIDNTIKT